MKSTLQEINTTAELMRLSEEIKKWQAPLAKEIHKVMGRYVEKYMKETGEDSHDIVLTQVLTNAMVTALEHVFDSLQKGVEASSAEAGQQFERTLLMALTGVQKRIANFIEEFRQNGVEIKNATVIKTSESSDTGWEMTKDSKP